MITINIYIFKSFLNNKNFYLKSLYKIFNIIKKKIL